MTPVATIALKLGACLLTLGTLGALFLLASPDHPELPSAQATIVDFEFMAPSTNTQRFAAALERLGHEKPRAFNYNGTPVFFSTASFPTPPKDLIHTYQQAFVQEGVNSTIWDVDAPIPHGEEAQQLAAIGRAAAMLDGQIQVIYHDPEHVILAGALIDETAPGALVPTGAQINGVEEVRADFSKMFKAHRHIDLQWHPVRQETVVTASWGDETFEIRKTQPAAYLDPLTPHLAPDPEVPPCPGCERLTRFAAESDDDKHFVKQIFTTAQDAQGVALFYRSAMTQRGWAISPLNATMHAVADTPTPHDDQDPEVWQDPVTLQFSKEGRFLTFLITPEHDQTVISVMNTD